MMNYLVTLLFFYIGVADSEKSEVKILGQINSRPRKVERGIEGEQGLEGYNCEGYHHENKYNI